MISFEDNIRDFESSLTDFAQNQLPFATALALNDTIEEVDDAWKVQLDRRLDRPTPFTKRGTFRRRATKRKAVATVAFKDVQSGYLKKLVTGGQRRPKGRAILIPVAQRVNKYGNLPKGAVARVGARSDTFVASKGAKNTKHLRPGIYKKPKRSGRRSAAGGKRGVGNLVGPQLLVAFEDRATYSKQLDLQKPAEGKARSEFPKHFARRFKSALATAK